jgi:hypothetical protein
VPKGKKTKTAIYHPPKAGMPYLVVTVSPERVCATTVDSWVLISRADFPDDDDEPA